MTLNPFRIALIDEVAVDRFIIIRSLKLASILCVVQEFTGSLDALAHFKDLQANHKPIPDLIISDLNMPFMDGFMLIEAIRAMPHLADVPIAILTSAADVKDRTRALAVGADFYFTKPVDGEIVMEIGNLLEAARLHS